MNIVLVNHYAISPNMAGGTRHFSFAKELVHRGHKVTIVASSFNHKKRQETRKWQGDWFQTEIVEGVRFVWIRTPPYRGNTPARIRNMVSFAFAVWRLPSEVFGARPDVIWGSSPHLFAALAAQRIARRFHIPFVLEVRDLWPESLVALGGISRAHPFIVLLEWIERYLYSRANHIITLLPLAAEHMALKGADASKITWIPNGIDLEMIPDIGNKKENSSLVGIYAGTHGLANGLDLLLDAAKILQSSDLKDKAYFRLVGDGPEKARLMNRAQTEGINNVSFEDPVPKNDVYKILAEADFFTVVLRDSPLYQWGISLNKLFDYMALCRPIVFSGRAPSNPVELSGAGIVTAPGDAVALAEGIRRLAQMSVSERHAYGQRGRDYVERHHAITILVNRLEGVLFSVVEEAINHRG